jgi:hypothetical protein
MTWQVCASILLMLASVVTMARRLAGPDLALAGAMTGLLHSYADASVERRRRSDRPFSAWCQVGFALGPISSAEKPDLATAVPGCREGFLQRALT